LVPLSWDIANELLWAKRYDEALKQLEESDQLFPNLPVTSFLRVLAYDGKGERQAAGDVLKSLKSHQPEVAREPPFMALFGFVAARAGRTDEARQILDRLEHLRQTQYVDPVMVLDLCSALNDHGQRLLWLKRGYEERSTQFVYLGLHKELYAGDSEAEAIVALSQ
jgi:tetratricopeptide (TPR) repeat protein